MLKQAPSSEPASFVRLATHERAWLSVLGPVFLSGALALAACRPEFAAVEEACHEVVPGGRKASTEAIEAFWRVNCYRRVAGMSRASIDYRVSRAARSHAQYFDQNGYGDGDNPLVEVEGAQGFTGVDPFERARTHGYDLGDDYHESIGAWEGVLDADLDPAEIADRWVDDIYWRQGMLQPDWLDAGYGTGGPYGVLTIFYEFPAEQYYLRPIAYPADGQIDVPTTYRHPYPGDTIPSGVDLGYPVTVTVGSDEEDTSDFGSANPYDLVLLDSELIGPDGQVAHLTVTPGGLLGPYLYSVALIPEAPLLPHETYTARFQISWNATDKAKDVETTFTTGEREASLYAPGPVPSFRWVERAL